MRPTVLIFACNLLIGKVFGVGHLRSVPNSGTLLPGVGSPRARRVAFLSSDVNKDSDIYDHISALQVSYAKGGAPPKQLPAERREPRGTGEHPAPPARSSRALEHLRESILGTRVMRTWLSRWNFGENEQEHRAYRGEVRRKTRANALALQIVKNEKRGAFPTDDEERDNYALEVTSGKKLGEWFLISNIRDSLTGKVIFKQARMRFEKVLGDGGTATVYLVEVHETDAKVLGFKTFALKFMKLSVGADHMTDDGGVKSYIPGFVQQSLSGFMEREVRGAKLIMPKANEKSSIGVSRQFGWSIPLFTAEFLVNDDLVLVDNVMYSKTFFLLEAMQGDLDIIYYQGTTEFPGVRLTTEAKQYVCMRLITEVAFLHSVNMVHYDIKPANVLISEQGDVNLADFGMLTESGARRPCNNNVSAWFMDPDHSRCFLDAGQTSGSKLYDTWAVGVTCFAVMTDGKMPYQLDSASGENIVRNIAGLQIPCHKPGVSCEHVGMKTPEEELLDAGISPLWSRIVELMLSRDRTRRPTLEQILVHFNYFSKMALGKSAS